MAVVYPNYSEGFPRVGHSPALDALQQLGSASPSSGMGPNPNRLTEAPDASQAPFPAGAGQEMMFRQPPAIPGTPQMTPPPATPPSEVSGQDQILASLRMAYPANRTGAPLKNMAPERREKPSVPALEG